MLLHSIFLPKNNEKIIIIQSARLDALKVNPKTSEKFPFFIPYAFDIICIPYEKNYIAPHHFYLSPT